MSYVKQTWVDRAVEFFRRFTYTDDGTHLTLTEAPGTITNAGTPLDSTRLNHIEEGIYDAHENVGDRQYAEENYVVSGETITESVNKLDTNLNLVEDSLTYEDISNLFTFNGTPDYAFVKKRKFDSQIFFRFNLKGLTGNANSPIAAASSTFSHIPPGITFPCVITNSEGWPKGLAVGFLYSTTLRIIPSVNVISSDSIRTGENI